EGGDLAVERGTVRALRRAERGRVDGLRPDEHVDAAAREHLPRQREVRVEDETYRVEGAARGPQTLVVAEVRLHDACRERRHAGRTGGELAAAHRTVREQRERQADGDERPTRRSTH